MFLNVGDTRKNAQVVTGLQTSCYKSVHKLSTSCVRTAFSYSCCNKFGTIYINKLVTSLMALSDLLQRCSNTSDAGMI